MSRLILKFKKGLVNPEDLVSWTRNILHLPKLLIYKSTVKRILSYGAETWSIKRKHRNKLLPTEMDSARSRMHIIMNETQGTKLTSWSWALLQKPPTVQPLKNFSAFYGTLRFITVFTTALHWSLS
jgi:hypothetical protein